MWRLLSLVREEARFQRTIDLLIYVPSPPLWREEARFHRTIDLLIYIPSSPLWSFSPSSLSAFFFFFFFRIFTVFFPYSFWQRLITVYDKTIHNGEIAEISFFLTNSNNLISNDLLFKICCKIIIDILFLFF